MSPNLAERSAGVGVAAAVVGVTGAGATGEDAAGVLVPGSTVGAVQEHAVSTATVPARTRVMLLLFIALSFRLNAI